MMRPFAGVMTDTGPARSQSGQNAPTPPDCRTPFWDDKVVDGINALPDENARACRNRNGAARSGLQHETRDERSRYRPIDRGHPRISRSCRPHEPVQPVRGAIVGPHGPILATWSGRAANLSNRGRDA